MRSNDARCAPPNSVVWKNFPITAVYTPRAFSISGSVTVPGGRRSLMFWLLFHTPVVSGRSPERNEERDGLHAMPCTYAASKRTAVRENRSMFGVRQIVLP